METNRYLSFSTTFPSYHPKAGQKTDFIEKIWSGLLQIDSQWYAQFLPGAREEDDRQFKLSYSKMRSFEPKYHTIRSGHRWKVGDGIIPFIWSGKPYRSKWTKPFYNGDLIIPIERVWDFKIDENGICSLGGKYLLDSDDGAPNDVEKLIAKNDGLTDIDFFHWLVYPVYKSAKPFSGQIICWNKEIRYLETDPISKPLPPINPNRKIIRM